MAKKKNVEIQDLSVEEFKEKANNLFEDNKNLIFGVIGVVVVLTCGLYYYSQMYMKPRKADAQAELYKANQYMDKDSFNLALNGKTIKGQAGNFIGYYGIIDQYSGTPASNLAHFYAGSALLNLGVQYMNDGDTVKAKKTYLLVLEFLQEYSGEELLQVQAYNMMGDAASELGNFEDAMGYYEDAAGYTENLALQIYSNFKLAKLLEFQKKNEEAKRVFQEIMDKDAQLGERLGVDKDLIRLK
ncbi:MAG: tetratricopeptide repeat protein [Saprospiraceae bacterium]|nr:tetratricopeptide repeat protein [Saprospiraceae bacterium]